MSSFHFWVRLEESSYTNSLDSWLLRGACSARAESVPDRAGSEVCQQESVPTPYPDLPPLCHVHSSGREQWRQCPRGTQLAGFPSSDQWAFGCCERCSRKECVCSSKFPQRKTRGIIGAKFLGHIFLAVHVA